MGGFKGLNKVTLWEVMGLKGVALWGGLEKVCSWEIKECLCVVKRTRGVMWEVMGLKGVAMWELIKGLKEGVFMRVSLCGG